MASQRASITKELLRESMESVLKLFKIHSLDDGKFSCVLEFQISDSSLVSILPGRDVNSLYYQATKTYDFQFWPPFCL